MGTETSCKHCYIEAGPKGQESMPLELRKQVENEVAQNRENGDLLTELGDTINRLMETGTFVSSRQLTEHYADLTDERLGYANPRISGTVRLQHMLEFAQKDLLKEELKKLDKYDVLSGPVTDHKGGRIIRAYEEVPVIIKNTQSIKAREIEIPMTDFVLVVDASTAQSRQKTGKGPYRPLEAVMKTLQSRY